MATLDDLKNITELTPELKKKIEKYKDRCTRDLYNGKEDDNYDRKRTVRYVEKIYEIVDRDRPVVVVADDPLEYKRIYTLIDKDEDFQRKIIKVFKEKNKFYKKYNWDAEYFDDSNIENEIVKRTEELKNVPEEQLKSKSHYLFLCSAYHRVYLSWYKFIQEEFQIEDHENKETLEWLYEHAFNNILRAFFTEEFVLVLKMPKYIFRNENGFHNTKDGALQWHNYKLYYINGRKLPKDLFEKTINKTLTFEEFVAIDNEDYKANIITMVTENEGQEGLMKFLDAKIADEKVIYHDIPPASDITLGKDDNYYDKNGKIVKPEKNKFPEHIRLWKTNQSFSFIADMNGNMNQPYAWLEMECPTTHSKYLIDTSAHFTNAFEAMKFHRPQSVPIDLEYDWEEFRS